MSRFVKDMTITKSGTIGEAVDEQQRKDPSSVQEMTPGEFVEYSKSIGGPKATISFEDGTVIKLQASLPEGEEMTYDWIRRVSERYLVAVNAMQPGNLMEHPWGLRLLTYGSAKPTLTGLPSDKRESKG